MRDLSEHHYTLADLTKLTGAIKRTVQFWAEHDVIRADRQTEGQGTGTHRRFTRDEAIIACIVQAFALRGITVSTLDRVADAVRRQLKSKDARDIIEKVIARKTVGYLVVTDAGNGKWQSTVAEPESLDTTPDTIGFRAAGWTDDGDDLLDNPGAMTMVIKLNTYLN